MRGGGYLLKPFPADVAIQPVLAPIRNEQIDVTGVVVVASANALTPAIGQQARFRGDVAETIVPLVVVKPIAAAFARDHEDIQQPIVVVIEQRNSASCCFNNELLRSYAAIWE